MRELARTLPSRGIREIRGGLSPWDPNNPYGPGRHPHGVDALEEQALPVTGPGGQVQDAPLPRATRKRLTALRDDVADRIAHHQPSSDDGIALPPGRALHGHLQRHRATGDGQHLAEAKRLAASAVGTAPGRGREADLGSLAWLGRGLLLLHDHTGHDQHLDAAERVAAAVRRLEVPRGGFRLDAQAPKDALDAVGNGAAARFLTELAWRIGTRGGHRDAAEKAVRRLGAPAALDSIDAKGSLDGLLLAIDGLLAEPLHATVVGPWENAAVPRLHRACLRLADDPLVLDWSPAGDDFPDVGAPCVYLSRGSRCASPVTDESRLAAVVARLAP